MTPFTFFHEDGRELACNTANCNRNAVQDKQPDVLQLYKLDRIHELLQIVLPLGDEPSKRSGKDPKRDADIYPIEGKKVTSQTGEVGIVRRSPDMDSLKTALQVRCCCLLCSPCD